MTTRASYNIDGHTFVAERGAPDEAASRLAAALTQPVSNSERSRHCGLAEDFCRANGGARLVRAGMQRGDTDYHYDVKTIGTTVHVMGFRKVGRRWDCFCSAPIEDFLLAYGHCEEIELAGA